MVALDASPTMVAAARDADPELDVVLADAAALPFEDEAFDLVVAFMSLQDMDDLDGVIREAARVLEPSGTLCFAIVHPLASAGHFSGEEATSAFVIEGSYLETFRYSDSFVRDGLEMTFVSERRPSRYVDAIAGAGLLVERLRATDVPESGIVRPRSRRWRRLPLFLHLRAVKAGVETDAARSSSY